MSRPTAGREIGDTSPDPVVVAAGALARVPRAARCIRPGRTGARIRQLVLRAVEPWRILRTMLTRRELSRLVTTSLAGAAALPACSFGGGAYEQRARETWRHGGGGGPRGDRLSVLRELVRYATLAPSSHNTQCWRFRVDDG